MFMRQACFTTPQECLPRRLDLHITLSCYLLNKTLASLMALVSFVCFSFPLWPDLHHRSSCNYIIDTGCTYLSFLSLKMQPEPSLSFLPSFLPSFLFGLSSSLPAPPRAMICCSTVTPGLDWMWMQSATSHTFTNGFSLVFSGLFYILLFLPKKTFGTFSS